MAEEEPLHLKPATQPAKRWSPVCMYQFKATCKKYSPYVTIASCAGFGINMMSPTAYQSAFGSWNVIAQSVCFGVAHLGTGLCIYSRLPEKSSFPKSVLVSVTGSIIFNYGSLLLLANIKHYLPSSALFRCTVGLGVIGYLLWVGEEYLSLFDEEARPVD